MSRNKDIKLLHEITGWSYKECRKRMKENQWDWYKACGFQEIIDRIPSIMDGVSEALTKVTESAADMVNTIKEFILSIDFEQLASEYAKLSEVKDETC